MAIQAKTRNLGIRIAGRIANLFDRRKVSPVFIVGSGRSGTSILLNTVRKSARLVSHGEGHFFPIINMLEQANATFYHRNRGRAVNDRHMLHHVPPGQVTNLTRHLVRRIYKDVYGHREFVDKTPGLQGIKSIASMQGVFPSMHVIYAQRRGLEVVRSAMLKFPEVGFKTHCEIWRDCVMTWRDIRPELDCPFLEVDQYEILHNPEKVTEQLAHLLGFSDRQKGQMLTCFQVDRPQSSGDLNQVPKSIDELGWTAQQIGEFRAVCGPAMEVCGYSETETYYSEARLDKRSAE